MGSSPSHWHQKHPFSPRSSRTPLPGPLQVLTAFNMLGPMLNPAHAAYGLVGVYSTDVSDLMADSLQVRSSAGCQTRLSTCAHDFLP